MKTIDNRYYIIRADRAGVFAGNIVSRDGSEVTLTNCRRLWQWVGANTLSDIALKGVAKPKECKFTPAVEEITVLGVIEIIPCSAEAESSIKAVPIWTL